MKYLAEDDIQLVTRIARYRGHRAAVDDEVATISPEPFGWC